MKMQARIEAAPFPAGIFSPVPPGHTLQSALATSLAMLRDCACDIEQRGGNARGIRAHIEEVEHMS